MAGHRAPSAAVAMTASLLVACGSPPGSAPTTGASGEPSEATASAPTTTIRATPGRGLGPPAPGLDAGAPRRAVLTVPAMGLTGLTVVPYRGRTDDARGTRIQDEGLAASPYGAGGGVGPGGLGNYQVTAHRTSSTAAFADLPVLRSGHRVAVTTRRATFVYEIRRTRQTSFRSRRSLAEQRAPVPGRPGATATKPFITLSTCATPEDHAAGNYWADELGNPEHRVDKIGVLVATRPRAAAR